LIVEAYRKAEVAHVHGTDDAALVERLGHKVAIVEGSWENIKVTTPEDLVLAEAILAARSKDVNR
jgi:2-C-methyl-D-erythritol 4-phosphate cytidylyltransferase